MRALQLFAGVACAVVVVAANARDSDLLAGRDFAPVWLFVDPGVVTQRPEGSEAFPGPVTKDARNPILREDKIWDVRWDNTYITARYDEFMKKTRLWWNSQLTCKGDGTTVISPHDQCGHPSWHSAEAFKGFWPQQDHLKGGILYAESDIEGVKFEKPEFDIIPGIAYDITKKKNVVVSNKTNILLEAYADPNRGVIYDLHETNASRRYKAFGSFWNDLKQKPGDCSRPKDAKNGDFWPSCTNIGVAFSADGIHFDHAMDESANHPEHSGNVPGTRDIGQDDGALDLAVWDDDLNSYWGLVRIDVQGFSMGGKKNDPCSDHNGTVVVPKNCSNGRRTGWFTTKDFQTFSHAQQAFNGSSDYEIYTIQPFRLHSYRPGYYLATGMFFQAHEEQENVECELLQTTNYGKTWSQIAPRKPFIPRGKATIREDGTTDPKGNDFDSHTVYTAWTGDQLPFLDPQDATRTRFYYSGGNGPHSGQRDDSIGVAYATTHAYAGLRISRTKDPTVITTEPLATALAGHRIMWLLADVKDFSSVEISLSQTAEEEHGEVFKYVGTVGATTGLQLTEIP